MRSTSLLRAGSVLGWLILATMILLTKVHSASAFVGGLIYIMAAVVLCLGGMMQALLLKRKEREPDQDKTSFSLRMRTSALIIVAWQVASIGVLNILALVELSVLIRFVMSYFGALAFLIGSYLTVSMADNPAQEGGYVPVNFFGFRRTRRLLFVVFIGYCTCCPLVIMSTEFALAEDGWRPAAMLPPQTCLLMAAIASVGTSTLLLRRYRSFLGANGVGRSALVAAIIVMVSAAVICYMNSQSLYVYLLSAVCLTGCVATVCSFSHRATTDAPDSLSAVIPLSYTK